ncbi:hypothetical protein KFE26_16185 [Shewanella sp. M16]|uniref:hypothetical protein n=1 Tax=Shewanella sp. M16 TaxID=2830837 RepID=UPI001BAF4052|nr:hypothetical protein [Shewanella sp. M16]MBS0043822.1 hypothetical protein [Shewanella sp. M16]
MVIQEQALSKLANAMRIYGEAHMNFNRLKLVDAEEAIDNLDRAMEAKLEAFHSLYDVTKGLFDYFDHADTAILILLRNAVHHRNHLLFKTWNQEMGLNEGHKKYLGGEFLLASHDILTNGHEMKHLYKLEDFYLRIDPSLGSPYVEDRISDKSREKLLNQLENDLSFGALKKYSNSERYPLKHVYINIIPIYISATVKVFKALNEKGVKFVGFDANAYKEAFTNELAVDLGSFNYSTIRIL